LVVSVGDREQTNISKGEILVNVNAMIDQFVQGENSLNPRSAFVEDILNNLGADKNAECPICFDVMQYPMVIPGCLHQW
jgi:DNA repair protein RAD5